MLCWTVRSSGPSAFPCASSTAESYRNVPSFTWRVPFSCSTPCLSELFEEDPPLQRLPQLRPTKRRLSAFGCSVVRRGMTHLIATVAYEHRGNQRIDALTPVRFGRRCSGRFGGIWIVLALYEGRGPAGRRILDPESHESRVPSCIVRPGRIVPPSRWWFWASKGFWPRCQNR